MELFHLTDLVINKGIPFSAIAVLLLTRIPETFSITVPMALIMAVIMTFSRMSEDNELISLRLAGYPLHQLLIPPLVLGLVLTVTLVAMDEYALPKLSEFKQRTLSKIQMINPVGLMQPRTYLEIPPYTLYADRVQGNNMKNVWIEDRRHDRPRIIISEKGTWIRQTDGQFSLRLRNGSLHQKGDDGSYRILEFDQQILSFNPKGSSGSIGSGETIKPLSKRFKQYRELEQKFEQAKETAGNYERIRENYYRVATNFHRSVALPFATFFLVLVTAPTGLLTKKYGTVADLVFCLGIFFSYYIVLTLAESLAKTGYIAPVLALWSPNLIFGTFGVGLFFYIRRYGV